MNEDGSLVCCEVGCIKPHFGLSSKTRAPYNVENPKGMLQHWRTKHSGDPGSSRGHLPRESLANWLRSSVGRHRHVGHAGGVCGLGRPGAAPSRVDVRSWERDYA